LSPTFKEHLALTVKVPEPDTSPFTLSSGVSFGKITPAGPASISGREILLKEKFASQETPAVAVAVRAIDGSAVSSTETCGPGNVSQRAWNSK
jgi:hypothetical protein